MSNRSAAAFAEFVAGRPAGLLRPLAESLRIELAVSDAAGRPILAVPTTGSASVRGSRALPREASLSVSIATHGEILGHLEARPGPPHLEPTLRALAQEIGEAFAAENDLERLTECLSQSYDELNLLYRISRSQRPDQEPRAACEPPLEETADFLETRSLVLYLHELEIAEMRAGGRAQPGEALRWLLEQPASLEAIYRRLPNGRSTVRNETRNRLLGETITRSGIVPYAVSPVHGRQGTIGFVGIFLSAGDDDLATDELRLIECLADQLSTAIVSHELYLELKDVLFNTVRSLVAAIDAKDTYTKGHSERVFQLSVELGRELGLSMAQLQDLSWSALLHDVGKIAVPERLLRKPGRLTPEEFRIIQTHPVEGAKVLEPIPQLHAVLPGIRHHHERVDGRGYPDGLHGQDIPLMARIIAVADTFDAMVSTRAYRDARNLFDAVEEIRRSAGTQLDPDVVTAFLRLVSDGRITVPAAPAQEREAA